MQLTQAADENDSETLMRATILKVRTKIYVQNSSC